MSQTTLEAARRHHAAGRSVIPVPAKQKGPVRCDWQHLRLIEAELAGHFPEGMNIGVLNGEPSGGLLDVDIDTSEALAAAPVFLPPTTLKFGRASNRGSHWEYLADPLVGTMQFKAPDGATLIELRSTGTQTIWPGSIHPTGEPITFDVEGEPATIDGNLLRRAVGRVAACALVARYWPKKGSRHAMANALAGALLRGGLTEDEAVQFVSTAAWIAGDEERQSRGNDVRATAQTLNSGKKATGAPTLRELLDEKVVAKLVEWLHLRSAHVGSASPTHQAGPSQATRLVAMAASAEFFHTADQEAYASVPVGEHWETRPVKNRAFRRWLARRFHKATRTTPSAQALQDAIGVLEGHALHDGPEARVFIRVAQRDGALYLDLANDKWEMVEITAEGWRVTADRRVRFHRPPGMEPLPAPAAGGSVELLRPFINVRDERDWRLLVAWLIATFRPVGPYPVLPLYGVHGTAKSTTARVLRACIDPNTAPLRSEPGGIRDLMIAARNGWVITLDNLSSIPDRLSDALCRLATGGALSTRQLYSDADEVIFEAQRPVLLTAIQEVITRGDLLDRSIPVYLPAIPDHERRTEQEFWDAFELARPSILGGFLDAVVTALQTLPTVHIDRLPRLADFTTWATAAESGLGWSPGSFMDAYRGSLDAANATVLDASPLTRPLHLLAAAAGFQGEAAMLLGELEKQASDAERKQPSWPRTPAALSGALRRLVPNLLAAGIQITFERTNGSNSRRLISIRAVEAPAGVGAPKPEEGLATAPMHDVAVSDVVQSPADLELDVGDPKDAPVTEAGGVVPPRPFPDSPQPGGQLLRDRPVLTQALEQAEEDLCDGHDTCDQADEGEEPDWDPDYETNSDGDPNPDYEGDQNDDWDSGHEMNRDETWAAEYDADSRDEEDGESDESRDTHDPGDRDDEVDLDEAAAAEYDPDDADEEDNDAQWDTDPDYECRSDDEPDPDDDVNPDADGGRDDEVDLVEAAAAEYDPNDADEEDDEAHWDGDARECI